MNTAKYCADCGHYKYNAEFEEMQCLNKESKLDGHEVDEFDSCVEFKERRTN